MTQGTIAEVVAPDRVAHPDAETSQRLHALGYGAPEALVHPTNSDEVATVLRWAAAAGVGVLPVLDAVHLRPARSGGVGTARWIGLCTDRLAGIEIYEAADLTLTAGSGTPMRTVADALAANGQWAPFDPPRALDRSLGGLVAFGKDGPLWTGYGELKNHVLGMTVVTGDGRTLRLGGRVVKNVAGFDLLRPMIGSKGALAVIISVTLRAFPIPPQDRLLTISGVSLEELVGLGLRAGTAPVLPVSSVVADAGTPRLMLRLHGAPTTVEADRATLEAHLGRGLDAVDADEARTLLDQAQDHAYGAPLVLEASARPSRLPELLASASRLRPQETWIDTYGGRIRIGMDERDVDAVQEFTRAVEALGGATDVVRGAPDVLEAGSRMSTGEALLAERLARAFDPEGVLWPAH